MNDNIFLKLCEPRTCRKITKKRMIIFMNHIIHKRFIHGAKRVVSTFKQLSFISRLQDIFFAFRFYFDVINRGKTRLDTNSFELFFYYTCNMITNLS